MLPCGWAGRYKLAMAHKKKCLIKLIQLDLRDVTLRVVVFWHCKFSEKQKKGKRIRVVLCIFVGTVHGHTTALNRLFLPLCSSKNHLNNPKIWPTGRL